MFPLQRSLVLHCPRRSQVILASCYAVLLRSFGILLSFVDGFPADHCAQHFRLQDFCGGNTVISPVQNYKICHTCETELAFVPLSLLLFLLCLFSSSLSSSLSSLFRSFRAWGPASLWKSSHYLVALAHSRGRLIRIAGRRPDPLSSRAKPELSRRRCRSVATELALRRVWRDRAVTLPTVGSQAVVTDSR
jgi:hypothetical protein